MYHKYDEFKKRDVAGLRPANSRTIKLLASTFGIELPNTKAAELFVAAILAIKKDYDSGLSSLGIRKKYNIKCAESHLRQFYESFGNQQKNFVRSR